MHALAVGPLRRGTEPQVPIGTGGRGRASRELAAAVSRGDPDVAFGDFADRARFSELDDAAIVVAGVNLRPHLRDELLLLGQLGQRAGLENRMRERLLAIDVLAQSK